LKNDSVIDSNVTEGIPSLLPVESKVTAYYAKSKVTVCNAMRGTRSARNNIREGGAILEVAADDNEDLYGECCTPGNIINSDVTEGVPSLPPVESKVMAYHAKSKVTACNTSMRVTHSARNDTREGGAILEVTMDDEDDHFSKECHIGANSIKSYVTEGIPPLPLVELNVFQHLYKSTKTTSSLFASHNATIKHGFARNDHVRRRD
jgi:hypothetical protein